jgi:hypothetical protein
MAIKGLPKSSSLTPVARHKARAPAMLRPAVVVLLRNCGMMALSGYLKVFLFD